MTTLGGWGSRLGQGFSVWIDLQSERIAEQIICGTAVPEKTGLIVRLNTTGVVGRLEVDVRDEKGKLLRGCVQLSKAAAKSVIIRVLPPSNLMKVNEVTIHGDAPLDVEYTHRQGPRQFVDLKHPLLVSGYNLNGSRQGSFVGRLGQVVLFGRCLSDEDAGELVTIKRADVDQKWGTRPRKAYSAERRQVFTDDLSKMKKWRARPNLSRADTLDASTVLFKWLFDKHPLLQDLCDEIGLQLSIPGPGDREKAYTHKVLKLKPVFYQLGTHGMGGMLGYEWMPLSRFGNQTAFSVEQHSISHQSFVRFVRHKLGGSHFDAEDRQKWQKDLKAQSDVIRLMGSTAIEYQMKCLLDVIMQAVECCGIEVHLTLGSAMGN
jgi:hypothetical protein